MVDLGMRWGMRSVETLTGSTGVNLGALGLEFRNEVEGGNFVL